MKFRLALFFVAACLICTRANSQLASSSWEQCQPISDSAQRLACFDRWAGEQKGSPKVDTKPAAELAKEPVKAIDCRNGPQSGLSRFWELEAGSDCGRFNIRGYRPITLSVIASDSVNTAPSSPSPGYTAGFQPYLTSEGRIQLSVRTKIGQGFLTGSDPVKRDSLWFGYTQQSYWQIFTDSISRPFRSTDHEPEVIYIVPTDAKLPMGWQLRYSGLSVNHQSNGQSLPLSRSWNRVILMAGMEKGDNLSLTGRIWQRLPEDVSNDDNPNISDYVGRAEVTGQWNVDKVNTLGFTVRNAVNLNSNGSFRLEWLRALGQGSNGNRGSYATGLRFHTQLFSGYGDSLLDYNRQRTVLSIGLSLVDW